MPKTLFLSEQSNAQTTFLRGELIDDSILIELLSWLQQSRRQACLTLIDSSKGRQSVKLYLQQGEVTYASSQNPHHRLGAILLRRGLPLLRVTSCVCRVHESTLPVAKAKTLLCAFARCASITSGTKVCEQ